MFSIEIVIQDTQNFNENDVTRTKQRAKISLLNFSVSDFYTYKKDTDGIICKKCKPSNP